MGFRRRHLEQFYLGKGERILHSFLLPLLEDSIRYDRITGYFTVDSLLAIANGIERIYENQGKMRVIIGVHSFPLELVETSVKREFLESQIDELRKELKGHLFNIKSALEKKRLVMLAWMMEDGLLEVKAASPRGEGIFHPKILIMEDQEGNVVSSMGSVNESRNGLGGNIEQLCTYRSWAEEKAVDDIKHYFDDMWNNRLEDVYVMDISKETADWVLDTLDSLHGSQKQTGLARVQDVIKTASEMPMNFFVSGNIPALFMHQERAVIDSLSRWPVRVLLADEVGLGKTFEIASIITYLLKYGTVKNVLILTPKSVLKQWQEELYDNFGLEFWVFDSVRKEYVSPAGAIRRASFDSLLSRNAPQLKLVSAQLARGRSAKSSIFESPEAVLPDILVLDEAHSARVSDSLNQKDNKTQIYKMLEGVVRQIPHVIFATATPMQKDYKEYQALLKLLGLPKPWEKPRNFKKSLELISSDEVPEFSEARLAVMLLDSTIEQMKPDLSKFNENEKKLVEDVVQLAAMNNSVRMHAYVLSNWAVFRQVFIKLHPARLLTVRNTRNSLEAVGYNFPKRNLHAIDVINSIDIQMFYSKVNHYFDTSAFSTEQCFDSEKKMNLGLVKLGYQQRAASSLSSCIETLHNRAAKLKELKSRIEYITEDNGFWEKLIDYDSLDEDGIELGFGENHWFKIHTSDIDVKQILRCINIETMEIDSLIEQAEALLMSAGDMKIDTALSIVEEILEKEEKVLLFSRYTDTVDALVAEYRALGLDEKFGFAVYTGKQSVIVHQGVETESSKEEIKNKLFDGQIKVVFCSDAASEGLNLQAAKNLINVDVPWTPARLEQRIGRVARLGQKAKEVDIYNIWFPNSVEARMYKRIEKRVRKANIALGEFPEIIAQNIKDAILTNGRIKDTSLEDLENIRRSEDIRALEELWANEEESITKSDKIRRTLIRLCSQSFSMESDVDKSVSFTMPDGTVTKLTAETGFEYSISLSSVPWDYADYSVTGVITEQDDNGRPLVFREAKTNKWIETNWILEKAGNLDEDAGKKDSSSDRPLSIPDFQHLDMRFIMETSIPITPNVWLDDAE